MQLYTFWRSSASYRVRIALGLKGLAWEPRYVHLMRDGGEQRKAEFLAVNPQGRVPALVDNGAIITQSLAIIEYLDETHPQPPLLPAEPMARARVRALAQVIACDIQPMQNTSTTEYLRDVVGANKDQLAAWLVNFIGRGLAAVEAQLQELPGRGKFIQGAQPGLAECCLVPQCFAARRFGVDVDARFPLIAAIDAACREMPAFEQAAPDQQGDRE